VSESTQSNNMTVNKQSKQTIIYIYTRGTTQYNFIDFIKNTADSLYLPIFLR